LDSILTLRAPTAFGGLTNGENGNRLPLPFLHNASTGLPINLGVIQQVGKTVAGEPLEFWEEPKRFQLGRDSAAGADDNGHAEVAGVAYEIDDVQVFGRW
jgi:hypothetical protein